MAKCSVYIAGIVAVADNRPGEGKVAAEVAVVAEVQLGFADTAAEVVGPVAAAVMVLCAVVVAQSSLEEHSSYQLLSLAAEVAAV